MGHWAGVAYTFKLNEEDKSYEDILFNMQEEINQKYIEERKDPGESFGASMSVKNGKVTYSSNSYKSRVSNDLSDSLIKKIQRNINTNNDCYYYQVDNGEDSAIQQLYGYAQKVGQYLLDGGYANDYGRICFYTTRGIEKFYECIDNKQALELVIREGEKSRLKREIFGDKTEINEYSLYVKKTLDSKEYVLNEKLLSYWLVYGTEDKYNTDFNYYSNARMNLKEYLFALDYKHYDNHRGIRVLKDLTCYAIVFKEGIDSVEGNFKLGIRYDSSGHEISKEKIESWYQEHKENFSEVPKISKNYANYLKENYPETFLKLKATLIELHNNHKALITENISTENSNTLSINKKKFL